MKLVFEGWTRSLPLRRFIPRIVFLHLDLEALIILHPVPVLVHIYPLLGKTLGVSQLVTVDLTLTEILLTILSLPMREVKIRIIMLVGSAVM